MSQSLANAVSLAVNPVSAASATGGSVRLDVSFETLKAEIDKISTTGPAGVDWKKVVALSSEILEKKSKDLLVIAYLCRGLFQLDGYPGLSEGLDALHQVMTTYWDTFFPDRPKGRIAAIQWLSEKTSAGVELRDAREADRQALETAVEKVKAIDALLGEKLGADAPSISELIGALSRRVDSIAAPAAQPAPPAQAPAAEAAPSVDLSSPAGLEQAFTHAASALREAAGPMRRNDSTNPIPYRMLRFASWSDMMVFPPHENGLSQIPPLGASAELLERYEGMASRGQWADLLEEAETLFEQSLLWLDLQRFVAASLKGIGGEHDLARAAVVGELGSLLRAFPGLQELRFNDEFPLASDATRSWIAEDVLAGGESYTSPTAVSVRASPEDAEINEILARARALASQKNLKEAINVVWVALEGIGPRRQRFLRKLALAHFLTDVREYRLALPVLEALDEEIRRFTLEEWEPGLSLDALRLYLHCQRQILRDESAVAPEVERKEREIFSRLTRLDAAAALELKAK